MAAEAGTSQLIGVVTLLGAAVVAVRVTVAVRVSRDDASGEAEAPRAAGESSSPPLKARTAPPAAITNTAAATAAITHRFSSGMRSLTTLHLSMLARV